MKKQKTGIYFNSRHGYYAYLGDIDKWVSLIDDGDDPIGGCCDYFDDGIDLTYVAKDIIELYSIMMSYEKDKLPEHIRWSQKRLAS